MAHFSFLACLMAFSFSVKGSDVSIGHEGVCRHDICAREMHKNTNKKGISLHDMRRKQKTLRPGQNKISGHDNAAWGNFAGGNHWQCGKCD